MASKFEAYVAEKSGDANANVTFRVAEAYKTIRTNLLFTLANAKNHTVVFSSAEPSAGKSTLCSNLAIVMAQTGARVVLVDADMRKPIQHRNFRLNKSLGLSKILGGLNTLDECIQEQIVPNLDLILAGSIPPNPSELLSSERMHQLLAELSERYDYVFIDMPPLAVVADALVVSPMAAGIVMVARQKQTTYDELGECIDNIRRIGSSVLGVVVTDVHTNDLPYVRGERDYRRHNYEYKNKRAED